MLVCNVCLSSCVVRVGSAVPGFTRLHPASPGLRVLVRHHPACPACGGLWGHYVTACFKVTVVTDAGTHQSRVLISGAHAMPCVAWRKPLVTTVIAVMN